jgi:hypothetical protein
MGLALLHNGEQFRRQNWRLILWADSYQKTSKGAELCQEFPSLGKLFAPQSPGGSLAESYSFLHAPGSIWLRLPICQFRCPRQHQSLEVQLHLVTNFSRSSSAAFRIFELMLSRASFPDSRLRGQVVKRDASDPDPAALALR